MSCVTCFPYLLILFLSLLMLVCTGSREIDDLSLKRLKFLPKDFFGTKSCFLEVTSAIRRNSIRVLVGKTESFETCISTHKFCREWDDTLGPIGSSSLRGKPETSSDGKEQTYS
jgi:hypothetical protein